MFDEFNRDDDRGQVGIGTLIVFIAMVLVAAIAAGVLINTAGFLQSGAEETGQQSSDQVTNRLQVVSAVGEDIGSNGVDTVRITVKKAPGANNIDLSTTTLQFVHSTGSSDLVFGDYATDADSVTYGTVGGSDGSDSFGVVDVQDEDGSIDADSNVVLNDPADRAQIILDTSSITSGLSEGDTATIQINTQSGGNTELRLVVPETLSGTSAVNL
ncbi:archaellin/type IV pilin N-terminal domain-containing protein [Haloarcula onubensis]|uniref:Flagellin n=1 Tax=Haloarcula onubensis TaxID=2950539 RepID=A0ABU2FMJ8_9EURY|nr:archaellin/type IV pilin N-terminal domain-containing protein [Halomicroarcula sp. S3CR25-11]MDS0281985.1 flagellin [Halomicroarcula sp. S3CR25-11]